MLEALKKAFGTEPKQEMEQIAPAQEELTDLTQLNVNEQLTAALNEIVAKDSALAELNAQLGNLANEIEGYKQQLETLKGFAAEAEAKALAAAEEMKAKEIADKKAQLADVIGADNPAFDTTFAAVESLDAEAFNVVVNGFKAAFAKEAESPFFKEIGVPGEAEPIAETGLNIKKHITKKNK